MDFCLPKGETKMKTSHIDIHNPEQYRVGVPHDKYNELRHQAPVHFQQEMEGPGYWAVMKHADVVYASKRPQIFSSQQGGINIPDPSDEDLEVARMIMINMDPPQHAKYRKLVSTGFTPRMTQRLVGAIQNAVAIILDRISGEKEVDFVATIASQLPLYLIADLIGWPESDHDLMFAWSNRVARIDYEPEDARIAAMEFWEYCTCLIQKAESSQIKRDDLLHVILEAEIDGESLSHMEIVNFLLLLAIGGNETTRNCISGGFLALHETPSQLEKFKADPLGLSESTVEEMLRWTSPITAFRRTAMCDTELGGQAIKEGEKVVLYYASANRDEEIFDSSSEFDIQRVENPHLSFGTGQHFCLGATLARMEIRILFEQLFTRFPNMTPSSEVIRLPSNYVNAIQKFMVIPGEDHR